MLRRGNWRVLPSIDDCDYASDSKERSENVVLIVKSEKAICFHMNPLIRLRMLPNGVE